MLPGHCKDVAVKEVDFPLTKTSINAAIKGKKAYTRCDHYVLRNGADMAVVRVAKADGMELFRPIVEHEVIALPRDVVFIEDDSVDVINPSMMARVAKKHPGKTVVVQGLFGHVSFFSPQELLELSVLDVIPPSPSKLSVLVERALSSGMVDLPIVPTFENIDLSELAKGVATDAVVLPCKASGLRSDRKMFYLDQVPVIDAEATLVGCDLSARIYRSLYNEKIERIEMCPQELAPKDGRKRLVKCCKVREGFQIKGDLAVVPWGATVQEVAQAITALFSR
ncbi:DUF7714 family protein [Methanomassiliicoccus luminyensis]|jgi:hypothetical protein|uniref:DUF7714 family protein n=1 Tax=Methanomassiliicoccus luminyensis TaxID=1080712 RepID=UPI00035DBC6A|nr:hypothetical protein [Methanomassiliicoccus luminyensis]